MQSSRPSFTVMQSLRISAFPQMGNEHRRSIFQYVGGGCGMKDVAYFISSCLDENECERREGELLDYYFQSLQRAFQEKNTSIDFQALEREWRNLYPVAWTDFYRFLQGWSPGHWKIHRYSERLAQDVLASL